MFLVLRVAILFSLLTLSLANDIPNCSFEDTVDLSNAQILPNGSYLYDSKTLISPDRVNIYDYEELYNGKRLPLPAHPRACACKQKSCIRFCCDPTKEFVAPNSRECKTLDDDTPKDLFLNVMLSDNSLQKRHAIQDFAISRGVPCVFNIFVTHNSSKENDWAISENGSLVLFSTEKKNLKRTDVSRKYYCMTYFALDQTKQMELGALVCPYKEKMPVNQRITYVTTAISIPFLLLTLIVYACIGELQNLHGKCFMSYLASLAVGCTLLCLYNLASAEFQTKIVFSNWCQIMGFFGYFAFMCVFFWLNVISLDVWQSFRKTTPVRLVKDQRFQYYSLYAWGVPLTLTVLAIAMENSNVDAIYKPGIPDACWINFNKWSAMYYYSGISLAIVLVNSCFFAMTLKRILTMKKEIKKVMTNVNGRMNNDKSQQDQKNFGLFFRLFLIMGIMWLFDAISYIETMFHPNFDNPLYYVTDVLNVLVGPLIFIFFILNRKVLGLLKKRYIKLKGSKEHTEEVSLN